MIAYAIRRIPGFRSSLVRLKDVGGVIVLAVHVWFAAAARRWLAFPFTGIPAQPSEAAGIFIHNLRALAAVGGLLLIAGFALLAWAAPRR